MADFDNSRKDQITRRSFTRQLLGGCLSMATMPEVGISEVAKQLTSLDLSLLPQSRASILSMVRTFRMLEDKFNSEHKPLTRAISLKVIEQYRSGNLKAIPPAEIISLFGRRLGAVAHTAHKAALQVHDSADFRLITKYMDDAEAEVSVLVTKERERLLAVYNKQQDLHVRLMGVPEKSFFVNGRELYSPDCIEVCRGLYAFHHKVRLDLLQRTGFSKNEANAVLNLMEIFPSKELEDGTSPLFDPNWMWKQLSEHWESEASVIRDIGQEGYIRRSLGDEAALERKETKENSMEHDKGFTIWFTRGNDYY